MIKELYHLRIGRFEMKQKLDWGLVLALSCVIALNVYNGIRWPETLMIGIPLVIGCIVILLGEVGQCLFSRR